MIWLNGGKDLVRRELQLNSQWAFGFIRDLRMYSQRGGGERCDQTQWLGIMGILLSRFGVECVQPGAVGTNSLTLPEALL